MHGACQGSKVRSDASLQELVVSDLSYSEGTEGYRITAINRCFGNENVYCLAKRLAFMSGEERVQYLAQAGVSLSTAEVLYQALYPFIPKNS